MIDLTQEILAALIKLKDRLRLVEVPDSYTPTFKIETIAGSLIVRPDDDWLACRFEDVTAAEKHCHTHGCGGRLNPYSGKWNWHWFDHTPDGGRRETRMNVDVGVENMLAAFATEVERLLPKTPGESS